ncbi:aminotransferase class I/II-fold pyridoxal phosphate-dependent enzyme [Geothrix sp. PMB-07]|uniref:aminotransferase class I/II-fold pyridoxal phosphate-dependent enzyme n=1 Tax=Geothrix sp. PMB-07 TaxID=3068640 RepID=UPI002740A4C4|nr:aminotransferase class I/II-fold pyridoxal phosphate-dependent enzyme [Geothrix sp. PMB-07]WLT30096.1 aminotransferase class I/II-fold pyridoxal phosphate-dependent enzyme [Geothrix sp. PMB-07]
MSLLRPDLSDLPAYQRPPEPSGGVRLHMNEPAQDWPREAKEALLARLRDLPFHQYPERQAELTERLGRRLGVPEGGLLLGPSSGALLDLVAMAGLSAGDTVAIPEPGFSLYPMLVRRHGGRVRLVPQGTGFPLEPWFAALDCRQIWLTLPNNPTGAWLSPEELEPLLAAIAARPNPPLVVLDEAYAEFAPATHRLAVDRYPNLLLLRTFSKALASAAWRIGYLVGDPTLVAKLATLQLPYSLPSASLEALDVALDFAADFEAAVRAVPERRDRFATALTSYQAAPSAGNFLHISPDPSSALEAAGLKARRLPGTDAARVTVGTEADTAHAASALGATLPPPAPRPRRRLLVLDIDGVLIDAGRSFMDSVARALAELRPALPWSDDTFQAFKRLGGFNNDFRLTAGALALTERHGDVDLRPLLESARGRGFPELEPRMQALEPIAQGVVQKHYADTIHSERPTVTLTELRSTGWDLAVLTGRPPDELELAWQVLGFKLPAVCDAAPHLRKPEPAGLLQLADAFRAEDIVFAGDTIDDARCLRAAAALRPELRWRFAAIGPDRAHFAAPQDLSFAGLRECLPVLTQELP